MIVTTEQGPIEGIQRRGAWQFRGIPYAAPPIGERRFMPPEPPEPWVGVRSGAEFGAASWQSVGGAMAFLGDQAPTTSEDCLFLNVFTPDVDGEHRPVMVWIHGGGFVNGSSSTPWYDGTALATRGDVVVVSVNYRLGALGFLWLGDLDDRYRSSGVNGLLDQAAALRWVQRNIGAFGGDPGNVTIVGESAGAMSVCTLLALPGARGLFHRAIAESGAASNTMQPSLAGEITSAIMSRLEVTDLDELLATSAEELTAAANRVNGDVMRNPGRVAGPTGLSLAMAFQPVVDGVHLPCDPLSAVDEGTDADVPLLIGTNRDEWNLFRLMSPAALDHPELLERLDAVFGEGHRIRDTYAEARPDAAPADLWSAVLTDATFRIPAIRLADARHRAGRSTYQYLFTWATPAFGGIAGSCHALEIPFVFGVLGNPGAALVLGGEPSAELWSLSEAMQDAWLAFARAGNPSHPGLPEWPAWNRDDRPTMGFDLVRELLTDPGRDQRRLWEDVV